MTSRIFNVASAGMIALLTISAPGWASSRQRYVSPDHQLVAKVADYGTLQQGEGRESLVTIRTRRWWWFGALCARRDLRSADHTHGAVVERAAWTPDSQFFIFTTASSGGHSSWQHPTWCYSRQTGKVFKLDPYVGIIAPHPFRIIAPNRLSLRVWRRGPDGALTHTGRVTVALGRLTRAHRKIPKPIIANARPVPTA